LLLFAKVTEEVVEEAREKVMVRSGRIGRHAVVKQFILEIIECATSMALGFEEMLVFVSSILAAPPASPVRRMRLRTLSAHRGSHRLGTRTNGGLSKWGPL
jgi:hypothetical protein